MSPFDRAHTISYSSLIETMRLSCRPTFFEIRRVLSKLANFDLPHLHLAPPLGVTPFEFGKNFWRQKTRVPGLSCGVVCVFLCLAILVELRLVTDTDRHRQTDTRPWHIPREQSSRGKNVWGWKGLKCSKWCKNFAMKTEGKRVKTWQKWLNKQSSGSGKRLFAG